MTTNLNARKTRSGGFYFKLKYMTTEQINEIHFHANKAYEKYEGWRLGQSYFNVLYTYYPDKADSIRGTEYDPYHKSNNQLQPFFDKLSEL